MADKISLDYVALGKRIKAARNEKGLTQEKLSEQVGLTPTYLSNVETAAENIGLSSLVGIANALDVGMDYLLAGNTKVAESYLQNDLQEMLGNCTPEEKALLIDLFHSNYEAVKKHGGKLNK